MHTGYATDMTLNKSLLGYLMVSDSLEKELQRSQKKYLQSFFFFPSQYN